MSDYTVKSGETLFRISQNTGVPVDSLCAFNNIKDNQIFPGQNLKLSRKEGEITPITEISDEEIAREDYIKETKNSSHIVKAGENYSTIAKKYNVETNYLLHINGLSGNDTLSIGQKLIIPSTRTPKNIKSLNDVAKAMGVTEAFIKNLKKIEDGYKKNGKPYGDNEFHNYVYKDCEGNDTIGIGHLVKKGDKKYLSNEEVLQTFSSDLFKMEENLWAVLGGKKNYNKLPVPIKETLLDMTFNKGTDIIKNSEGLIWCLKNGKYEAAINKMTNVKTFNGTEVSGLCKRRLFDISVACKVYGGDIPSSNKAAIQDLYNKGVELLKQECEKSGNSFENLIVGFHDEIQSYFGDKYLFK